MFWEEKKMKTFWATARMCLVEKSYFGLGNLIGEYLLRTVGLMVMLMVWRSLALQGVDMQGLSLNQLMMYTILTTVLRPLLDVRTPDSDWLHDGTVLSLYLRPAPVLSQLAAYTVGGWCLPVAIMTLPGLLTGLICGVDFRPASLLFLPSLVLSVAEGFAVDFLFACLLIRLKNLSWVMECLRTALCALLTGAVIPFAALPWGIGRFLALTPLGTLAGAAPAIYVGLESPGPILLAQACWTVLLWPLAIWRFRRAREKMISYGG